MSGGGSFGFAKSDSETDTRDLTPFEFASKRGFVADTLAGQARGNVPGIDGPFVAGITQGEKAGLNAFQQASFGPGGIGSSADSTLQGILSGSQSPELQNVIDAAIRPVLENAELQELRDRSQFTGSGQKIQGSSAFAEDRMRSLRDTQRQVGDISSQIAFQDFQQRQAAQIQAAGLVSARLNDQREAISTLALPRLIEQLGIDKGNEELARRMQVIQESLLTLGDLGRPTLGQFSRSDSQKFETATQGGAGLGGGGGE